MISFNERSNKEVKRRINLGWNKFWSLKFILKNKSIDLRSKINIFKSCVTPVLTYGSQTWSITKNLYNKLETTQRAMLRSILEIKKQDRVRNETIYYKTKIKNIVSNIKTLKWKWAGHVYRQEDGRWTKKVTEWCPIDKKRRKGRQNARWSDDIKNFAGNEWSTPHNKRQKPMERNWRGLCPIMASTIL